MTASNAATIPLSITGSNVVIPNLSNAALTYSSNAAAAASTKLASGFTMTWSLMSNLPGATGVFNLGSGNTWVLDTAQSVLPSTTASNYVTNAMSNGSMVIPVRGMYSLGYSHIDTATTARVTSWMDTNWASNVIGLSGGIGTDSFNGSIVRLCNSNDKATCVRYTTQTGIRVFAGFVTMSLLYPL
jgi:hypothetical protein